jgi:hypothetical protein
MYRAKSRHKMDKLARREATGLEETIFEIDGDKMLVSVN